MLNFYYRSYMFVSCPHKPCAGLPGKILMFFASLIVASLPVTGFYIWWGRRQKKIRQPKYTNERLQISLNVKPARKVGWEQVDN
jgi:uncharacterized iron-regulated membrane protein